MLTIPLYIVIVVLFACLLRFGKKVRNHSDLVATLFLVIASYSILVSLAGFKELVGYQLLFFGIPAIILLLAALYFRIIHKPLDDTSPPVETGHYMLAAILPLLYLLLFSFTETFINIGRNGTFGIRTPYSMSSDSAWIAAHREVEYLNLLFITLSASSTVLSIRAGSPLLARLLIHYHLMDVILVISIILISW